MFTDRLFSSPQNRFKAQMRCISISLLILGLICAPLEAAGQNQSNAEIAGAPGRSENTDPEASAGTAKAPFMQMQEAKYDDFEAKGTAKVNPKWDGRSLKLIGNIEEQNLAVEWNEWHNRFARTVRNRMFSSLFETINMKAGATCWYSCEVDSHRHITNIKITKSSGDFWYDSAVVKAVNNLEGTDVLAFPEDSKRSTISTEVGIQLGGQNKGDLNFGDVEYRPIAPGESSTQSAQISESEDQKSKKKKIRSH
ncbi:MAG: hypothetical protein K2X27_07195 [Candidatus Obscuribacterales bacterium]|nr:hypothetical protein [Candidatus Obscuribacterales bacterium]